MAITKKRKVSEEYLRQVWKELKSVTKVARRISYTVTGTHRALYRLGVRK
jgi:GTPase